MFEGLDSVKVIETIDNLSKRIDERFPQSGLHRISVELLEISRKARDRADWISQPRLGLRLGVGALIVLMLATIVAIVVGLHPEDSRFGFGEFVGVLEAGINVVVVVGIGIFFLINLERRLKRARALQAVHELRAIAHVIDMHQLSKDPDRILGDAPPTASEPKRLSSEQLGRYLDFCSEMLSIVGKIAALYTQKFDDDVAIASVNELEALSTGLTRKIWQKLMILHSFKAIPDHAPTDG